MFDDFSLHRPPCHDSSTHTSITSSNGKWSLTSCGYSCVCVWERLKRCSSEWIEHEATNRTDVNENKWKKYKYVQNNNFIHKNISVAQFGFIRQHTYYAIAAPHSHDDSTRTYTMSACCLLQIFKPPHYTEWQSLVWSGTPHTHWRERPRWSHQQIDVCTWNIEANMIWSLKHTHIHTAANQPADHSPTIHTSRSLFLFFFERKNVIPAYGTSMHTAQGEPSTHEHINDALSQKQEICVCSLVEPKNSSVLQQSTPTAA